MRATRICSVVGCGKKHYCRSYCLPHYQRVRHHGSPDAVKYGPMETRFWRQVMPVTESGCWLWIGCVNAHGYGRLNVDGTDVQLAHRVSWVIHRGAIPDGLCHKCDTPPCVNPDHLFLGDSKANMRDAMNKGRCKGAPRKLTDEQVREVRRRQLWTPDAAARELGVTPGYIRELRNFAYRERA